MVVAIPSFREVLNRALALAWAADAEHAQLRSRFDSDTDPEYLSTPRLQRDRLTNFLFQLHDQQLQRLHLLVAVGRGEELTIEQAHRNLARTMVRRDAIIRGLVERLPLAPYLWKGVGSAQDQGVDLDATW
jgi:hypothetical protein